MIGKVPPDVLEAFVLGRTGAPDDRVVQGPAYGEDTAAIALGEQTLVVNTDPISLAVDRIGTLGVTVVTNDVAASGATPEWLTSVLFLPDESERALDSITAQLDDAARELDVSIVGGHSEYDPGRETPLLVLTCLGTTDRYVPTGGGEPGDRILMTKSAGIEATAILASDFRSLVTPEVPDSVVEDGLGFYERVSVVADAELVAPFAHAMHDPTEGGLVDGLLELAVASDVTLEVDPESIPVASTTAQLCGAAGIDPLRTFGSGALLAAVPADSVGTVEETLDDAGIEHAIIGTATERGAPRLEFGSDVHTEPVRDEMYALWE